MPQVMRESLSWDVAARDVPRDLWPTGRVRVRLGTRRKVDATRARQALAALRTWHAWDVIRAVQAGTLPLPRVVAAVKERGESAVGELRRALAEQLAGTIPTIREHADIYLDWYAKERAAQSHKQVASRLKRFCEQRITVDDQLVTVGDIRRDRLTRTMIEDALRPIGNSDSTREAVRLAVSGMLTHGIEQEADAAKAAERLPRWAENPAGKVERRERGKRITTASDDQVLRLLAGAEIYQAAYVRALVHLGLREAELHHTRLHDDLDLRDWTWRIQPRPTDARCPCPSCQSSRGWRPKSRRGIRTILVPDQPAGLRGAITAYLDLYPAQPGDFVFRNPRTGRLWDAGTFDTDLRRLCERADVRYGAKVAGGITAHTLRHTCATNLVRAGVDSAVIAELLGDTVKTIVDTYLHLTPKDVAAAVSRGPAFAETDGAA